MGYPTITYSIIDTNPTTVGLTGDSSVLIRHFSNAKATMYPVAYDGASIDLDMCIIRNGNETGYGTEHTFNNVSDKYFVFSTEDSNGRMVTEQGAATMVDYVKLTCYVLESKPDASGNAFLSCWGGFFNGSFGARSNTLSVSYRYRLNGGSWSSYTGMSVETAGNMYTATATLTGLDYEKAYDFEFIATDALMTANAAVSGVRSVPVFHWGENDFVVEVPATFNGDAQVKGDLRLKGDGNFGNYLRFGDGSYCYIAELTDDEMTIKADAINLDTSNFKVNGQSVAEYGTWTPSIDAASYYTAQRGWYNKVGNIVTVGFYIKATCYSGWSNTDVCISGLPYTPVYAAAGGGVCSGALMVAAQNFQCFMAETNGTITTRVQACDNTIDQELITSASGCKYPPGALTLGGTITYMVAT